MEKALVARHCRWQSAASSGKRGELDRRGLFEHVLCGVRGWGARVQKRLSRFVVRGSVGAARLSGCGAAQWVRRGPVGVPLRDGVTPRCNDAGPALCSRPHRPQVGLLNRLAGHQKGVVGHRDGELAPIAEGLDNLCEVVIVKEEVARQVGHALVKLNRHRSRKSGEGIERGRAWEVGGAESRARGRWRREPQGSGCASGAVGVVRSASGAARRTMKEGSDMGRT